MKRIATLALVVIAGVVTLTGCSSKADTVSSNLSKDADNFDVSRQIVFYNGITDKYVSEVDGRCALGNDDPSNRVSVICEVSPGKYIKDFFFKSDNTTVFVLQTQPSSSDPYHYEVNLRPTTVIPNLNVR